MEARGTTIRRKRQGAGRGLRAFAIQVGISPSHLSRIERGQRGAQPEVLDRIARVLGVPMSEIAKEEMEGKS